MVSTAAQKISKAEFWALADAADDVIYELIDGIATSKMSPKYFHARAARKILMALHGWAESRGRLEMEWAFDLNEDSTPVPDLIYVSFDRLPANWDQNTACPVVPELAIEIISPGQTFGQMAQKASLYLKNGVLQVWVVDTTAQSVTILCADAVLVTYRGDEKITDVLFPGLSIITNDLFT